MGASFFFNPEVLGTLAAARGDEFQSACPFPHVVLDDVLPAGLLREVVAEAGDPRFRVSTRRYDFDTLVNAKWHTREDALLGPKTRQLLYQFNAEPFINFLELLTGIEGLIPDPHYVGGGLHQIGTGGFLKIHADFNRHPLMKLDRRLNLLLYLNEDWDPDWGGVLELWSRDMTACERRVTPDFNRMVVFATTDTSYHGHPDPLRSPEGVYRRSLALYYYTNGRPAEEQSPAHSTLHQARPGERIRPLSEQEQAVVRRQRWQQFVPPILIRSARALRKRALS